MTKKNQAKTFSKHVLIYDMSSDVYHKTPGTFSSSQLKTILEDEQKFYRKYISKEEVDERIGAFDVGTYFHTAVLEPEKLENECVIYSGGIRNGGKWDTFCAEHMGKAILTKKEHEKAEQLVAAFNASPIAKKAISEGSPEVSLFVTLLVHGGVIYSEHLQAYMTPEGWRSCDFIPIKARSLTIKVRADFLSRYYIADLKSTTGNAKCEHTMKSKVSSFNYDLSAALYLDMFNILGDGIYSKFLWIFASKDFGNCKTWVASYLNIKIGRAKWMKAILKLAHCLDNDWKIEDTVGVLEPNFFERENLISEDLDLL